MSAENTAPTADCASNLAADPTAAASASGLAAAPPVPTAPDTTDRITILLNGEPTPLPADIDLRALLERLDLADRRLAIEVNGELVPRGRFGGRRLTTHDRVEIIQAVGGG